MHDQLARGLSRRSFVGLSAAALASAGLGLAGLNARDALAASAKKDASASASAKVASANAASSAKDGATRTITDCAGRTVTVPAKIERVAEIHPIAAMITLRLSGVDRLVCVDKVFAQVYASGKGTVYYDQDTLAKLQKLPVVSPFFASPDKETLVSLKPDVIFTLTADQNADQLQKDVNIPVVCLAKSPMDVVPESYKVCGQTLGNEDLANQMADWWTTTSKRIEDDGAAFPEDQRPTVMYCGKGGEALGVPGKDTVFGTVIRTAGCRSVSDELSDTGNETISVSMEQVIEWDPDIIVAATADVRDQIKGGADWAALSAVKNGTVYASREYAGFDGLTSVLGAEWLNMVALHDGDQDYEDQLDKDMKDYFELFNGLALSDDDVKADAKN